MNINKLIRNDIPVQHRNIPSPPKLLYAAGEPLLQLVERKCVAIVGSRKLTPYGRQVTTELAGKIRSLGGNQWGLA
jgi:DNA processing protein